MQTRTERSGKSRRHRSKTTQWLGKKPTNASIAREVIKVEKQVRDLTFASEIKYTNTDFAQGISTVGVVYPLNLVATGNTNLTRIGKDINVKSVFMRTTITAADNTNVLRYIIFRDSENHGVVPGLADLLDQTGGFGAIPTVAPLNMTNAKRFKVYFDRSYGVESAGGNEIDKVYRKLNFKAHYIGNGATQSDLGKNSLYLLVVSDSNAISHPPVAVGVRVKFTD